MSRPTLISVRPAPLGGKISWTTCTSFTAKVKGDSYKFCVQTTRWFAIVSNALYKAWRIVMIKGYQLVGRVVAEFDTKNETIRALDEIKNLFRNGFENKLQEIAQLKHGDIVSVPTKMIPGGNLRHFGIYDKQQNQIIEYQPDNQGGKGSIQATPFATFCERVKQQFNGNLDLRKHAYIKLYSDFQPNDVVKRAKSKIGHRNYNALFKNCETFAVWCKTGKKQSIQSLETFEFWLDVSIKVTVVICVVVVIAAIQYYFGVKNIQKTLPKDLQVAILDNGKKVIIEGTKNYPKLAKTKAVLQAGGGAQVAAAAVGLGVLVGHNMISANGENQSFGGSINIYSEWEWSSYGGSKYIKWTKYPKKIQNTINNTLKAGKSIHIKIAQYMYEIEKFDQTTGLQKNIKTGKIRTIRRNILDSSKSNSVGDDDIDVNNNNKRGRGSSSVISAPPYKKRKLNRINK